MLNAAAIQIWVQPAVDQSLGRGRKNRQDGNPEDDKRRVDVDSALPIRNKGVKNKDRRACESCDDKHLGEPPMDNETKVHQTVADDGVRNDRNKYEAKVWPDPAVCRAPRYER